MLRAFLLLTLGVLLCGKTVLAEELINWHEDLAAARQISQQYKVPLLIHFYGDQCMPCKTLEQNVFTRPEVASTMQRYFVPVRINATRDRRTAAEYGVHSWPQDVFVAPDGKTLVQGVCNQNPGNYLQNLQNVALMNRDRNAMLAGNQPAPTTTPSPYGRTASTNLQTAAPGRDAAPTPYSNPSTGSAPYGAPTSLASTGPIAPNHPALPSPTWQGQSANGEAKTGQTNSGPIPNATGMTLPPPQSATVNENKLPNVPGGAYWQGGNPAFSNTQPTQPGSSSLPLAPASPAMPATPNHNFASLPGANGASGMVANPHYSSAPQPTGPQAAMPQWTSNNAAQRPNGPVPGQLVASGNSITRDQKTEASLPTDPQSLSIKTSSGTASVPALCGYCPVALCSDESQWIKGSEKFAIRHRGRIYFLADEAAAQKFLAAPDNYTPILAGHDPLIYLRDGQLVEGSIYDGVLKDRQYLLLFSSEANKQYFHDNYDRLISELEAVIRQQVSSK